jgi:hypothetical protein
MLQYAEKLLSREKLWERQSLTIESGHPGPGVRDTIEYVTGCVSAGRFILTCDATEARCVSDMMHIGYAIQWFAFAIITLLVWLRLCLHKQDTNGVAP